MRNLRPLVSLVVLLLAITFWTRVSRADDVAPGLARADLRARADLLFRLLVTRTPAHAPTRGAYVAFDPSASDPIAQVACDDDGDYVIVLSDAMLSLVADVARASRDDARRGSARMEEYATFLARSQVPGRRLLPPPAGAVSPEGAEPRVDLGTEDRWNEMILFLLARERAHLRAGDLSCPRPTVTKELGDDVWTAAEQRGARSAAIAVYPGRAFERDTAAIAELSEANLGGDGAVELLRFFGRFEAEARASGFAPSYLALHPRSAVRLAAVKAAVAAHPRKLRDDDALVQ